MTIKIPKNTIFPLILAGTIIAIAWLAGRGQSPKKTNEKPQTRVVTKVTKKESATVREVDVTAKQFSFSPNLIRVQLGDLVKLNITSTDVAHGFSLPTFGIDEPLPPGETRTIQFQVTTKGEFPFACSQACGSGHAEMTGTLIVE